MGGNPAFFQKKSFQSHKVSDMNNKIFSNRMIEVKKSIDKISIINHFQDYSEIKKIVYLKNTIL